MIGKPPELDVRAGSAARVEQRPATARVASPAMYALWAIDPGDPAPTMKVMAQRLRCNASSLTSISDRLVRLGYVTRTEDPSNRRFRVLALTPAGTEARQRALDVLEESCPLIRLTEVQQDDLMKLLGQTLIEPEWTP